MRRMYINGARALVAFGMTDIPHCTGTKAEAEAAELARDMHWLDTGEEVSPLVDLEPPTRAVN